MIDKLEFVLALARERHFGRAAEACGVTQPTLSAGLKSLEEALGVLIVHRSSRFQGFTREGERVLTWARRIVDDARSMREDLATLQGGLQGHVRLAVIPTALPMVARLTTPFRAKHPNVRFTVLSRTSALVLRLLDEFEIDAGITYLDNEPLGHVRVLPLYSERYRLLIASDSPLARRPSVTWADIATLPLCLLTPDMQNRRIIDEQVRASTGQQPAPRLESDSVVVLLSHVATGGWSSVVPSTLVEVLGCPKGVASVPVAEPDIAHAVGLVMPYRTLTTPLLQALAAEATRQWRSA
jgi:DNA-binding transcriptional LysR family regulator